MNNLLNAFNLSVASAIYAGSIALWYLFWLFVGDANWWLVLSNRFAIYLFVPGLILFMAAILKRRVNPALPLLVPAGIFLVLHHPYLFPEPAKPVDESGTLKVMTYNLLFSNTDYDAVANVVLTHQPDLVAMQEVKPDMMKALIERLQEDYPYYLMGTHNDFGTTAVFSRHAFLETQILDLQIDRPAVMVKTKIKGQEVTFVSAHLLAYNLWWTALRDIPATVMERTRNQNRQARIVLQEVNDEDGIVIVGCDCNSYETSSSYRILDGDLENAARRVGLTIALDGLPGVRQDTSFTHIDYVWFRGGMDPVRIYKILDQGGSDHLPVLAIFEMD